MKLYEETLIRVNEQLANIAFLSPEDKAYAYLLVEAMMFRDKAMRDILMNSMEIDAGLLYLHTKYISDLLHYKDTKDKLSDRLSTEKRHSATTKVTIDEVATYVRSDKTYSELDTACKQIQLLINYIEQLQRLMHRRENIAIQLSVNERLDGTE